MLTRITACCAVYTRLASDHASMVAALVCSAILIGHRPEGGGTLSMSRALVFVTAVLAVVVALVAFLVPQATVAQFGLSVALVGIAITLIVEVIQRLSELEDRLANRLSAIEKLASTEGVSPATDKRVLEWTKRDGSLALHYSTFKQELDRMTRGTYSLRSLEEVFRDDVASISGLRSGDTLRSTCPMPPDVQAALAYVKTRNYLATIAAHEQAAARGVTVVRIYEFKDRTVFNDPTINQHICDLAQKFQVRALFRSEARIVDDWDFLVFGHKKVSVGEIDPDESTPMAAEVHFDPAVVQKYISNYDGLVQISVSVP